MMRRGTNKRIGRGRPPRSHILREECTLESSQAKNTTNNVGDGILQLRQQSNEEMPLQENATIEFPVGLEDPDLENQESDCPTTRGPYRGTPLPTNSTNRTFLRVVGDRFVALINY